ncbi:MAG TPA: hypothetical protein VGQ62_18565, partial [Chloroflexota bacterium]|nr:hypothetical protein [Chloroflexota bacterium]
MTTTDSAQVTPAAGGPVAVHPADRVGARAPAAVRAERRAWLILWVAFATFCTLIFAVVKFSVDYVSTAEVDQGARVTASRGLVIVNAPGSADRTLLGTRTDLGVGTLVTLDRSSVASAELQLFDDSKIKVLGGASVELTRMEVGRFINQHSLQLTQLSGPIRYMTGGPLEVVVPNGQVQLAAHGDYTVWLDGDTTRVLVYGGEARVSASGTTVTVADGKLAEIDPARVVHPAVERRVALLANSDFVQHDQNWEPWDKPNSPLDVNGTRGWVGGPADASGAALRVLRESVKGEHGETGLIQKLDRDVSGYRHLWLRAAVRVDYADLSGGGTLGSEYPMMLRLRYEGPVEGSKPDWAVGFYYSNQDNRPVPDWLGQLWPQGEWKT